MVVLKLFAGQGTGRTDRLPPLDSIIKLNNDVD